MFYGIMLEKGGFMETEITVQVFNSFKETDKILKGQGFKLVEEFQLNDWYFSHIKNAKNAAYARLLKNSFLLREVIGDSHTFKLCYKNKEINRKGDVIGEQKTSAKIEDFDKTLKIFTQSGLNNWCVLKNHSYAYEKDNLRFSLQVIEALGTFIEYEEDDFMKEMRTNEKIEFMKNVVSSLGLKLGNDFSCKKVYMKLHSK